MPYIYLHPFLDEWTVEEYEDISIDKKYKLVFSITIYLQMR
jgi:hypothetical protein